MTNQVKRVTTTIWLLGLVLLGGGSSAARSQQCAEPVARQDRVSLPAGATGSYSILIPSPLWNDSSSSGRALTLSMALPQGDASTGRLEQGPGDQLLFTGAPGSVQTRYFQYTVQDGNRSDAGTVRVTEGFDFETLPSLVADYFEVPQGCGQTVLEVLSNDAIPGGPQIADLGSVRLGPLSHGAVTIERRQPPLVDRLQYRPQPCETFTGRDEFEYVVEVNGDTYVGRVVIDVLPGAPPPGPFPCFTWLDPNVQRSPTLIPPEIQRDGVFDVSCARQSRGSDFPPDELCFDFGDGTPLVGTPGCAGGSTYSIERLCVPSGLCYDGRRYVHRYAALGTYVVRQRARVGGVWSDWTGRQVTVTNAPPEAALAPISCYALGCYVDSGGTTDDFDAPQSLTYTWDFGDDSPFETGPNLEHVYEDFGTYPVTLVVTDSQGGMDVLTRMVEVTDLPPVAGFTDTSCGDRCLSLTATTVDDFGLAGHEWRWQRVGDGVTGLLGVSETVELRSSLLGLYDITLTSTDGAGQTGTRTRRVELGGALRAATDWWILPPGVTTVAFDPRVNDGPGAGLSITAFGQGRFGSVAVGPNGTLRYQLTGVRPAGTDHFSYTVTDNQGTSVQGSVRIVTQPLGEVGRSEAAGTTPATVALRRNYGATPLVFATPASANDPAPVVARVTSVKPDSFNLQIQAPSGGAHAAESVDYLVVAPFWQGTYGTGWGHLDDSRKVAAGRLVVGQSIGFDATENRWLTVSLPWEIGISGPPLVLAQVQTNQDGAWVSARVDRVTATSFRVALEVPENGSPHGAETVAWVAFPPGASAPNADLPYEAMISKPNLEDPWLRVPFSQSYPIPPLVLGSLRGRSDPDPAVLRRRLIDRAGIELAVQEDTTRDPETNHGPETANLLVFAEPAVLAGATLPYFAATDGGGLLAGDDGFTVFASGLTLLPILANDQPGAGDLEILGFVQPAYGAVTRPGPTVIGGGGGGGDVPLDSTLNGGEIFLDGDLVYHPPSPEFRGRDYFEYTVRDAAGNRATVFVTIDVVGENEQ